MNVSKQKSIKIGITSVLVITVVILAIQIRSYVTFYDEVQKLIEIEEQSVKNSMEGIIDFQKIHIEHNNQYDQQPYASSPEELENWMNYNLSAAETIRSKMLSDKQTKNALIELSFANKTVNVVNEIKRLYNKKNKESIETLMLKKTEDWALANLEQPYIKNELYRSKVKETIEVLFGAEDTSARTKFIDAVYSVDSLFKYTTPEDLKDQVINKRKEPAVYKVIAEMQPSPEHIAFIFSSNNYQFIKTLEAKFNANNKATLQDIASDIVEKWVVQNSERYQAEITDILAKTLSDILKIKAVSVTGQPLTPSKKKTKRHQDYLARILHKSLSNDYVVRHLAQPDLTYSKKWTNRYPNVVSEKSIESALSQMDFDGLNFLHKDLGFELKNDSIELDSLEQFADSSKFMAQLIHQRVKRGKKVKEILGDGNGNTLAIWLYTNNDELSKITRMYSSQNAKAKMDYRIWQEISENVFDASTSINEKLKNYNIEDYTAIFRSASSNAFNFSFSIDTTGIYTTEELKPVTHNGSLVAVYEDFYQYYLKSTLGSIGNDDKINDSNPVNRFVYEKYASNLIDDSSKEFMPFVDFLELNLHLVNLNDASLKAKKLKAYKVAKEGFENAYAQNKENCKAAFDTLFTNGIESFMLKKTEDWALANLEQPYIKNELYRSKVKETIEVLFGAEDTSARTKFIDAVYSVDSLFKYTTPEDLKDQVINKRKEPAVYKVIAEMQPSPEHIAFIFSSNNYQFIKTLEAKFNAKNKTTLQDMASDSVQVDSAAWRAFSVTWDLHESKVISCVRTAIDNEDLSRAKEELDTLMEEKKNHFRKSYSNEIAKLIFKDIIVNTNSFALRLGKFKLLEIKIDREDYLGFLNEVRPPSYVVFKNPLINAKETLIAQSPENFTVQGELKWDAKVDEWEIGEERKNWESDRDDDDE